MRPLTVTQLRSDSSASPGPVAKSAASATPGLAGQRLLVDIAVWAAVVAGVVAVLEVVDRMRTRHER